MTAVASATAGFVVALTLLLSPDAADAQWRARPRQDDRVDVGRLINLVESHSNAFRRSVDRALDRSRLNGSRTEDQINEEVKQFENEVDRLRGEFDRRDNRDETRRNIERVLRQADEVNRMLRRSNFARDVDREWSQLRAELNTLAGVYNLKTRRG
jgi:hypothetical protein